MAAFFKTLKSKVREWLSALQKGLRKQRKKLILQQRAWLLRHKKRQLAKKQAATNSANRARPSAALRAARRSGRQRGLTGLWKTVLARTLSFFYSIPKWVRTFVGELLKFRPRAIIIAASVLVVLVTVPIIAVAASGGKADADVRTQSALELAATPTPIPTPTETPFLLEKGMDSAVIMAIQQRLMDLGYMDSDEPTEHFGPLTAGAVKIFQRQHKIEITGTIDDATMELLMGEDAQKYVVEIGVSGTDVKELQKRLYELGYLEKTDSVFGEKTQAAVQLFQQKNGLEVNGIMDEDTREMLYSEEAKANALERGMEGEEIKTYQERLYQLGYLTTKPDGKFGADTVNAVKRFQTRNGLIDDGYIGPETKLLLLSSSASYNALSVGMEGKDVRKAQERLKALNYLKAGAVDGYFGSGTQKAVLAFQKRNGLSQDGKIGKNTSNVLFSSKAKKASSTSSGGSGGSGSGGGIINTGDATADKLIQIAKSKLGCKYVGGAKGPNQFDCSGFAYWCLNQAGIKVGYMTSYTWRTTTKFRRITSMSSLQKGDIIIFKMSSRKGHVGIIAGGGMMYDASSSNGEVVYRSYGSSYWKKVFYCGYRIF